MKVRELIAELSVCEPDADVLVEQTDDQGPERVTAAVRYPHGTSEWHTACVVLEGNLFH